MMSPVEDVERRMLQMVILMAVTPIKGWLPVEELKKLAVELCEERRDTAHPPQHRE
jgi:hypothetical protein